MSVDCGILITFHWFLAAPCTSGILLGATPSAVSRRSDSMSLTMAAASPLCAALQNSSTTSWPGGPAFVPGLLLLLPPLPLLLLLLLRIAAGLPPSDESEGQKIPAIASPLSNSPISSRRLGRTLLL
jgi:peptidoglycan/LPS O-acetylase OafA/YrhL